MGDSELLHKMIVDFMKDQNAFNLDVINRLGKVEARIYAIVGVGVFAIEVLSKYFFQ